MQQVLLAQHQQVAQHQHQQHQLLQQQCQGEQPLAPAAGVFPPVLPAQQPIPIPMHLAMRPPMMQRPPFMPPRE